MGPYVSLVSPDSMFGCPFCGLGGLVSLFCLLIGATNWIQLVVVCVWLDQGDGQLIVPLL